MAVSTFPTFCPVFQRWLPTTRPRKNHTGPTMDLPRTFLLSLLLPFSSDPAWIARPHCPSTPRHLVRDPGPRIRLLARQAPAVSTRPLRFNTIKLHLLCPRPPRSLLLPLVALGALSLHPPSHTDQAPPHPRHLLPACPPALLCGCHCQFFLLNTFQTCFSLPSSGSFDLLLGLAQSFQTYHPCLASSPSDLLNALLPERKF